MYDEYQQKRQEEREKKQKKLSKKIGVLTSAIVISIISIIFLSRTIHVIPAGYVGVIYKPSGGVQTNVISQGWHLVSPFKNVTKYSVATEQAFLSQDKREGSEEDESCQMPTVDGKLVKGDIEFSYHFDPEKLPQTFVMFKGQEGKYIEQTYIRGHIKAWAAEAASKFSVMDMYGAKRAELNHAVFKHVNEEFKKVGIIIDTINFPRIEVDAQTSKAIQERINAQQQLEKEKVEKEKAEILAQKKLIEAKADADAKLIKAKAEADSNNKIQSSITSTLVEYKKIDKWDGKQPQVVGGNPIVDLRK